ncbi:MAG: dynamin family protein [Paludibacteraceae bacterium]|nr:dynamin family protein [Paludibacteraceae bacterium]
MNKKIELLEEIADYTGMKDCISAISNIKKRLNESETSLILPIVGEFSSGKTTLINALTDSKMLETATKPTTATIYAINFGREEVKAEGVDNNGILIPLDINSLKNEELVQFKQVNIYDTNKKLSKYTILVDTPGLASNEKSHKEALMSFLPQADAVIMSVDVNKQFTSVNREFVNSCKLANREVFVMLTMCDSKTDSAVADTVKLINKQENIPLENIICISASTNKLDEFYELLNKIERNKRVYIKNATQGRMKVCAKQLLSVVIEMLNAGRDDSELSKKIKQLELEKSRVSTYLDGMVMDIKGDIDLKEKDCIRIFGDTVFDKLDELIAGSSTDIDGEARTYINGTAKLLLGDFKTKVSNILQEYSMKKIAKQEDIENLIGNIDVMKYSIEGLSYDIDLKNAGHEYDSAIVKTIKYGSKAVKLAMTAGTSAAEDVAETVVEEGADALTEDFIEDKAGDVLINALGNESILNVAVAFMTEHTMAKPQRRRVIHNYLDEQVIPQFKEKLMTVKNAIIDDVKLNVKESANSNIENRNTMLKQLQTEYKEKHDAYLSKMKSLNKYKLDLENF